MAEINAAELKDCLRGYAPTKPVIEQINFKSGVGIQTVAENFVFITRALWSMKWEGVINYDLFGINAALVNGVWLTYNGERITPALKDMHAIQKLSFDFTVQGDAHPPTARNFMSSRFSFTKFAPNGLQMHNGESFGIENGDNLLASANLEMGITLEGWTIRR